MVAFYKHNIPSWRGGTANLSDRAFRVYHVLIEEMMLQEGPVVLHERTLAGLSNRSTRDLRAALEELCAAGKIRIEGGKIHNDRAAAELEAIRANRENAAKGGRKVREDSTNGPRMVHEPPANGPRKVSEVIGNANEISVRIEAPLSLPKKPKREEKSREESESRAREIRLELNKEIVAAFQQNNRPPPAMHQTEIWLAQGYSADLIKSVIRTRLAAMKGERNVSLAYFGPAIAEAAATLAPAAVVVAKAIVINGRRVGEALLLRALKDWREDPALWTRHDLGPAPFTPGCGVPAEYLDKTVSAA